MGLINWMRDAFARLFSAAPAGPKSVKIEIPGSPPTPLRPPPPPRKRYMVGGWSLAPFPPAALRMEAGRLGRFYEFKGYDDFRREIWRIV